MGGIEQDLLVLTSPRPQKHPAEKGGGKYSSGKCTCGADVLCVSKDGERTSRLWAPKPLILGLKFMS